MKFILYIILFLLMPGCRQEAPQESFVPNTGQIQVMNACGMPGAAELVRNFLTEKGFDIVEFGNAPFWNLSETIIVARTSNTLIAADLARILSTDRMVQLVDSSTMVAATVFVGKDYFKRIK